MDKINLSNEVLIDIAKMVVKLLRKKINPSCIYKYQEYTSFGQYSHVLDEDIGISYYHHKASFHGNVNGGGHFSGTIYSNRVTIVCSQSNNTTSVNL